MSLIGFAIVLTRVDSTFAGCAYAAYGGIYIAASLGWLWIVKRQRPSIPDIAGAAIAIAGAIVIIAFASNARSSAALRPSVAASEHRPVCR